MEGRRGFLRALGLTPLVAVVAFAADIDPKVEKRNPDQFIWSGWRFYWTGWKPAQENLELHGQWVALSKDGRAFYQNSGGSGSNYNPGDMLDLRVIVPDRRVFFGDIFENGETIKAMALTELKANLPNDNGGFDEKL